MADRRSFLLGLGAALAAPAVVRADSLMKIAMLRQSLNDRTATDVLTEVILAWERGELWKARVLRNWTVVSETWASVASPLPS